MAVPITALYAGLLTLIGAVLGAMVGAKRGASGISILHGDDMDLATRIRRHGNWAENAPLAVVLLAILELNGASAALLHGLGIVLVAARIAHPIGLRHDNMRNPLRGIGAGLTVLATAVAALVAIWEFLSR